MLSTRNQFRPFRVAIATGAMLAITAGFANTQVLAQGPITSNLPALSAVVVAVHHYPAPELVTARPSYNVPQAYFIQEKTYGAPQAEAMIAPGISQRERAANAALGEYYAKLQAQQAEAMIAPGISQRERAANAALGEYYAKLQAPQAEAMIAPGISQRERAACAALGVYYTKLQAQQDAELTQLTSGAYVARWVATGEYYVKQCVARANLR